MDWSIPKPDFIPTPPNEPNPPFVFSGSDIPEGGPPRPISFRFGSRTIAAMGRPPDPVHRNVLRLQVNKTLLERAVQAVLIFLPLALTSWVQTKFPEWFLPDRIILKVQKDGWDEEFDLEKAAYEKLRALQGITIPKYLGAAERDGIRAMVLSDIGEHCIATPEGAVLDPEDFKVLLHEALTSLTSHGVSQDDTKLDNFHHVIQDGKDKIMVVDLEMVSTDMSADDFARATESTVDWLTTQYRGHRKSIELDGLIHGQRPLTR